MIHLLLNSFLNPDFWMTNNFHTLDKVVFFYSHYVNNYENTPKIIKYHLWCWQLHKIPKYLVFLIKWLENIIPPFYCLKSMDCYFLWVCCNSKIITISNWIEIRKLDLHCNKFPKFHKRSIIRFGKNGNKWSIFSGSTPTSSASTIFRG